MASAAALAALGITETPTETPATTAVATATANTLAAVAALGDRIAKATDGVKSKGGAAYVRFDHGQWFVGKDRDIIPADARFLVDVARATHGWIVFAGENATDRGKGGVLFSTMVSITSDAPAEDSLPAFAPDASIQRSYGLVLTPASDPAATYHFETATLGGAEAWATLLTAAKDRWTTSPGALPVVSLSSSSYLNKSGKRVHKPLLKVVEWQLPG